MTPTRRAPDVVVRRALLLARSLRSPGSGLLGQGVRFGLAGATVALVYLTTTIVLAEVFGVPFQVALAIGFSVGLVVHFTLQRVFVWTHHEEFALPLHQQAGRYLIVAGVQYGVTAASTSLLPAALGVSTEIVYLVTVAVVLSANFLVFRHRIFHAKPAARPTGELNQRLATNYDMIPGDVDPRTIGIQEGELSPREPAPASEAMRRVRDE